jgi:hypothetical protein
MFSQRQVAEFKEASYLPVLKLLNDILPLTSHGRRQLERISY